MTRPSRAVVAPYAMNVGGSSEIGEQSRAGIASGVSAPRASRNLVTMAASPRPAATELASSLDWRGTERYEVLQCLGCGGMGAVYEVRDRESGQHLALKTLLKATP